MEDEQRERDIELQKVRLGYQAAPAQPLPPSGLGTKPSEDEHIHTRDGDRVVDFSPFEKVDEGSGEEGERARLIPVAGPSASSTSIQAVDDLEEQRQEHEDQDVVVMSRAQKANEYYHRFVHWMAKDLQDHNTDFPFRLAKTEWKNFRHFVAGSSFVANQIWAPIFWSFFLWDLFPGLALANPLYGVSFGRIMGGVADNAVTITSIWGSDVAGDVVMYYGPAVLIGSGIATGGGLWTWPRFRERFKPELKAFHEKLLLQSSVYRNFIQWKAGTAPISWKDMPFWLIILGVQYADLRFIELCILKFIGFVQFLAAETDCHDQNKLWAYLNDWGNFECVVTNAGYLADYQKFTSQQALDGLLAYARVPDFILENIDELLKHPFGNLDLSRQNWRDWPRLKLRALLSKVSANIKSLEGFNISSPIQYSSFPDDGRLDDVVEFLHNVTTISFSGINQGIGQTGFEEIWEAVVAQLKEIEMGGNNVQAVPTPLNATGVTRFSAPHTLLGDTGLTGLQNSKVEDMDVSDVGMTGQGITSISQQLPGTMKKIKVANNNFQGTDMKPVAEGFAQSNMEEADFSGTQLVDDQVNDLTSVQSKKMKKWKLRNNGLTNVGLFSAVQNCRNTTVTEIDLYGNAIDDDGVTSSIGFLPETALNHLGLGNTAITPESIKLLGQSGKVKSIDSSYNPIGPDVVNMLMQNKVFLEKLDLTSTSLNTDAGIKLVGVLPGSTFKSLILGNNNLQDPFLIAFATALPNTGVVVLDVNLNQLTDASVTVLAKTLPRSGLERVVFDSNPGITDAGGVPLVQSLVEPTEEANTIGQEQVGRYEARALRNAKLIVKLKEVSLQRTAIERPTIRAAEQVLSGRDFTFRTNSSSQFYSNPNIQPQLGGGAPARSVNSDTNNMAASAVGLSAIIPGAILLLLAVYLIYRMSKSTYNFFNSEGTPSCKK